MRVGTETTMNHLNAIAENFELLGDWDQRYLYLTELGEKLAPMPESLKTEANKVKGCMSEVWVSAYCDENNPSLIQFHGDCETSIIKGVLAVLIHLTGGKTAQAIEQLDVDEIFETLDLDEHLSPNRHIGVYAIVELMKQQVRQLLL